MVSMVCWVCLYTALFYWELSTFLLELSPKCDFISFLCTILSNPSECKIPVPKGTEVIFWTGVARQTKESLPSQHISHQPRQVGGKQTSRTNHADLTMNICKISTPLREIGSLLFHCLITIYFSHCTIVCESMLSILAPIIFHVHNIVNPLQELASDESKSLLTEEILNGTYLR